MITRDNALAPATLHMAMGVTLISICILSFWTASAPVTLAALVRADRTAMVCVNGDQGAMMDYFWYHYSRFDTWVPAMAAVAATLWTVCRGNRRQRLLFMLAVLLLFVVLDQLSSGLIKPLVERLRPSHDPAVSTMLHYVNGYHGGRFGFVSGHACNTAGLCTLLCLTTRSRAAQATYIVLALMTCFSRIYLGVHFPGDVLCGAALGVAITLLFHAYVVRPHFDIDTRHDHILLVSVVGMTTVVLMGWSAMATWGSKVTDYFILLQ